MWTQHKCKLHSADSYIHPLHHRPQVLHIFPIEKSCYNSVSCMHEMKMRWYNRRENEVRDTCLSSEAFCCYLFCLLIKRLRFILMALSLLSLGRGACAAVCCQVLHVRTIQGIWVQAFSLADRLYLKSEKMVSPQNNNWQWHFTAAAAQTRGSSGATTQWSNVSLLLSWH